MKRTGRNVSWNLCSSIQKKNCLLLNEIKYVVRTKLKRIFTQNRHLGRPVDWVMKKERTFRKCSGGNMSTSLSLKRNTPAKVAQRTSSKQLSIKFCSGRLYVPLSLKSGTSAVERQRSWFCRLILLLFTYLCPWKNVCWPHDYTLVRTHPRASSGFVKNKDICMWDGQLIRCYAPIWDQPCYKHSQSYPCLFIRSTVVDIWNPETWYLE